MQRHLSVRRVLEGAAGNLLVLMGEVLGAPSFGIFEGTGYFC